MDITPRVPYKYIYQNTVVPWQLVPPVRKILGVPTAVGYQLSKFVDPQNECSQNEKCPKIEQKQSTE